MFMGRIVARNVLCNWLGTATQIVIGFFVAPFLVSRLGDSVYGLWIIIGSLTGYFGLLDLGVQGSVGRYVAYHVARNEHDDLSATVSSAAAILVAFGAVALAGTLVLRYALVHIVVVPPDQIANARLSLTIVGFSLSLMLVINLFDATLWGLQRFDVLNAIDIPAVVVRAGLTFWAISRGHGLVALAWITLFVTAGAGLTKGAATFQLLPMLRLRPGSCSRARAKRLFAYGSWNVIRSTAQTVRKTVGPILIASGVGLAGVTVFSIASRLVGYAVTVVTAATGVLVPIAAGFHATDNAERQRQLFVEGGRLCLALSLFFVTVFIVLGKALITLWVGSRLAVAAAPLAVIALGELLPMSQQISEGLLLGSARHMPLAWLSAIEGAGGMVLVMVLLPRFGLMGASVALAVSATVCRGLMTMWFGCRAAGIPLSTYARDVLMPPLVILGLPSIAIAATTAAHRPAGWHGLVEYSLALSGLFTAGCVVMLGIGAVWAHGAALARRVRSST